MQAVRDAVDEDIDIMVDLHGRTSAGGAIAYADALAPFRPLFFEEPCQPGNPQVLRRIARAVTIPIATGERLTSLQEFRDLLALDAVAVLQPDVCHVGGPTALRKIAALAESHHIPLAPHNPLGPIATAVNQHVAFATPAVIIQEVMRADVPWRDDVVTAILPHHRRPHHRPHRRGLGHHRQRGGSGRAPVQPRAAISTRNRDGSVADW